MLLAFVCFFEVGRDSFYFSFVFLVTLPRTTPSFIPRLDRYIIFSVKEGSLPEVVIALRFVVLSVVFFRRSTRDCRRFKSSILRWRHENQ